MVTDLPPGLTHPAAAARWFGYNLAGHFFRWVDGDRYVAVLKDSSSPMLVDAIPFKPKSDDVREDLAEHAMVWAQRHGHLPKTLGLQPRRTPRRPR